MAGVCGGFFFEAWGYDWRNYFSKIIQKSVAKLENIVFLWEKCGLKRQFDYLKNKSRLVPNLKK